MPAVMRARAPRPAAFVVEAVASARPSIPSSEARPLHRSKELEANGRSGRGAERSHRASAEFPARRLARHGVGAGVRGGFGGGCGLRGRRIVPRQWGRRRRGRFWPATEKEASARRRDRARGRRRRPPS